MAKKIIFSIVFIILFIGSILAIYFGIGYFNEKNKWQRDDIYMLDHFA